jgi:hypothetical protein
MKLFVRTKVFLELMMKSHIAGYTRQSGSYVRDHDDSRKRKGVLATHNFKLYYFTNSNGWKIGSVNKHKIESMANGEKVESCDINDFDHGDILNDEYIDRGDPTPAYQKKLNYNVSQTVH